MTPAPIDYFPAKLAKGNQFCNRIEEKKALKKSIELTRHAVLISPRRYGKSSLVHKVVSELSHPFVSIDLFLAHNDVMVTKRILDGISCLISQIIPITQKALTVVQRYFNNYKVMLNAAGFSLELSHTAGISNAVDQIFDALNSLARLAEEKKTKVIFFIDEFQDIIFAESAKAIQGAIRHVTQDSAWIMFIFSGSSRRLLLDQFDDKSKPLYMLCDKFLLDRMSSTSYLPYLQKAAQIKWNKIIDDLTLNRIFTLTELHPFYINMLCHEIWKDNTPPTIDSVTLAWSACYEVEERRFIAELEKLTSNQQDLLRILAVNPVSEPTSHHFLTLTKMPLSSVRVSMKALIDKDMVHIVKITDPSLPTIKKGQYRVLDPLLAFALRKYS